MNTEDKIFNKIKTAANQKEMDFSGMDKVWNRVEEKLDNRVVVQKKNTWRKLAVAASVLLVFSVIYQYLKPIDKIDSDSLNNSLPVVEKTLPKPLQEENSFVVNSSNINKKNNKLPKKIILITPNMVAEIPTAIPVARADYDNKTADAGLVMAENEDVKSEEKTAILSKEKVAEADKKVAGNLDHNNLFRNNMNMATRENGTFFRQTKFETRTSNYDYSLKDKLEVEEKMNDKVAYKKMAKAKTKNSDTINSPLIVENGRLLKNNLDNNKVTLEEVKNLTNSTDEEIIFLQKPLYIINGEEYTEESLFGKKPSSPYYPLSKQKITSTSMLEPAAAVKIYGKKGENGIVIITTKGGVPLKK